MKKQKKLNQLNIKSGSNYLNTQRKKLPSDLPAAPDKHYNNKGWTTWGEFLNRKSDQLKEFIDYNDLKKLRNSRLVRSDYQDKYKKIKHKKFIPGVPATVYKNSGWKNWAEFLGTKKLYKVKYWSFNKARSYVVKFKLKIK